MTNLIKIAEQPTMKAKKRRYFEITDKDGIKRDHDCAHFKEVCELYGLPFHYLKQTKASWKHKGLVYKGIKIREAYK